VRASSVYEEDLFSEGLIAELNESEEAIVARTRSVLGGPVTKSQKNLLDETHRRVFNLGVNSRYQGIQFSSPRLK
jgi:hypothetical protein